MHLISYPKIFDDHLNKKCLFLAVLFHGLIFLTLYSKSTNQQIEPQIVNIKIISSQSSKQISSNNNLQPSFHQKSTSAQSNVDSSKSSNSKNVDSVQSEVIFDAQYLNNPAPIYPSVAKSRGIEGKVLLEVLVSDKGEPLNIKIISSSGSYILDESAFETVQNWQFIPAKKMGKFVQASVIVPIEFKIET
ncbi:MAG: energy transducer TonB [Alphaproteobacteria bacterium]|nr:energy transducer TonB [Alphaproteobacteria bacterium]